MIAFILAASTMLLFPFAVAMAVRAAGSRARTELSAAERGNTERIEQLERAVESLTAQMDRIAEGQRFLTKLLERSRQT